MSTQFVVVEGFDVSPIKVSVMGGCFIYFFLKVPYINKTTCLSFLYWIGCLTIALAHSFFRFSTVAYLGLFLVSYIVYYNLINKGILSLKLFKKILAYLLYIFCFFLILQQISIIIGITDLGVINLSGNYLNSIGNLYYEWNRLPSLTCEPSHTARIIAVVMLSYIRCIEIEEGKKISLKKIFDKENFWVTLSYLWLTFMIGSGTGWIGFIILCLYFVHWKSFLFVVPVFILIFILLFNSNNKQVERVKKTINATLTLDIENIKEADGSAATRVIPVYNTIFKTDILKFESWIGKGTLSFEESRRATTNLERRLPIIEQYGLIGFILSIILFYSCAVYRIFSIETLVFLILYFASIGNEYTIWAMMFIFSSIRYFQMCRKNGCFSNNS